MRTIKQLESREEGVIGGGEKVSGERMPVSVEIAKRANMPLLSLLNIACTGCMSGERAQSNCRLSMTVMLSLSRCWKQWLAFSCLFISALVSAQQDPIRIFQAEDAILMGAVVETRRDRPFDGRGYVNFTALSGGLIEWRINNSATDRFVLQWAYQLQSGVRPLRFEVNDQIIETNLSFPAIGNWVDWAVGQRTVSLNAGWNTVRLITTGSEGPNFDYLTVVSVSTPTPTPILTPTPAPTPAPTPTVTVTPTATPKPHALRYRINFSDALTAAPQGWLRDTGLPFGSRADGLRYGWRNEQSGLPFDLSLYARNRAPSPDKDVWRETLVHFHHPKVVSASYWEIALPNGTYRVSVQAGDALAEDSPETRHVINAEGELLVDFAAGNRFGVRNGSAVVQINDGALTLDSLGGYNSKINSLVIESADGTQTPAVLGSTPQDGERSVSIYTSISANYLLLVNPDSRGVTSINNASISDQTAALYEVTSSGDIRVDVSVNGTGGGDAINLSPRTPLNENTQYRMVIRGVTDMVGEPILPFSAVFTTAIGETRDPQDEVGFERVGDVASGHFTSLTFGPDGKLYGLGIGGDITRWTVNTDGSLSHAQLLTAWHQPYTNGVVAVGLVFSPAATADNLLAYVSHSSSSASVATGPDWDCKITRLQGSNLEHSQVVVTNLPRSSRDHLTNSLAFKPGDANTLYFNQGSNSGGGRADGAWGGRPERLLSAATLRLQLDLLPQILPLDVRTSTNPAVINAASTTRPELSDGSYNPYYQHAALTLFATGVRNAYDLVWHSNGQLYVPTNGTGGGSLSPESVTGTRRPDGRFYAGQSIPAVGPNEIQRDMLIRVDPRQPLAYYGHPNPLRGEYVLNRGSGDVSAYPAHIEPDSNFKGYAYDFNFNKSPNGVIEYQSDAHAGYLRGALIVTRYSGSSDLLILYPNTSTGDIARVIEAAPGLSNFADPLDLVEDVRNGNLYVSDFNNFGLGGRGRLILLRPMR